MMLYGRGQGAYEVWSEGRYIGTITPTDDRYVVGDSDYLDAFEAAYALAEKDAHARLERLRASLRAECISTGELIELEGLAEYIDPGDVELLEAAGVPEFPAEEDDDE